MRRRRKVVLRGEQREGGSRHLWARLDAAGDLHIDGQDLGAGTEVVSSDGEYEWFQTIAAEHLPRLVELLGGRPGDDVLTVLEQRCTGAGSYELERVLRTSGIPVKRFVW